MELVVRSFCQFTKAGTVNANERILESQRTTIVLESRQLVFRLQFPATFDEGD